MNNDLNNAINDHLFGFALSVQELVKNGWTFDDVHSGDRYSSASILVTKGDISKRCYTAEDVSSVICLNQAMIALKELNEIIDIDVSQPDCRTLFKTKLAEAEYAYWSCSTHNLYVQLENLIKKAKEKLGHSE